MKFTAVGDYLTQRRLPPDYEGLNEIIEWMKPADVRYFNLETTLHREGECFGFVFYGGSYLRAEPEVLEDCKRYGFNMTSFCNNHSMDYAYDGLLKTLEHVNNSGLVHAGAGRNLDQASAPAYLEAKGGRIALIGLTSSGNDSCDEAVMAGKQSRRVPGRPGVNLLRYQQTLYVTPEQMKVIKQIAEGTCINAAAEISRREGYSEELPEGMFKFGELQFRESDRTYSEAKCDPEDLARVDRAIHEAKLQADYILITVHSHQLSGVSKEQPSQFLEDFARHCIDQGADAVIGHGPHLLRPIEIYKGKPIFYSLGDFMLENENIPFSPEDYYEKRGLTSDDTMHELFRRRSRDFTRGLQSDMKMLQTVIPRWEMEDGRLTKLELLPVQLSHGLPRSRVGLPAPAKDDAILRRLAAMSEPYGTKMHIENGIATVVLEP